MAKDCDGNEIKVGDVVQRVTPCGNTWFLRGFNPDNLPVKVDRVVDKFTVMVEGYPERISSGGLKIIQKKCASQKAIVPTFLKGEFIMNTSIIVPQQPIKKIIFLYDNGRKFHASKIKKFLAVTKDIDGVECIEYSNRYGAHRVYRDDLAAITFVCDGGLSTTQELKEKVVVQHDNARMKKNSKQ